MTCTDESSEQPWKQVQLRSVVSRLTNGYVGPTRDIYVNNGIPYLLARHVHNNNLSFDGQTFVSESFNQRNRKSILRAGDVLMVQSGHIGETAVVPPEHEGHNCHAMIVITPQSQKLTGPFLSYYFHSPEGMAALKRLQTGATLPHLNCRDVDKLQVPLPPLAEQRRIAAILDKADAIRLKREEGIRLTEELLRSTFLEMFGDPVHNNRNWPTAKLGAVARLDRGKSRHRPRDEPSLYGGPYPFIQTGDISNCDGYIEEYSQSYSELGLAQSKLWPRGTLCITIAANIAKTGILAFDACFPDSVVGLVSGEHLVVEYIRFWFVTMEKLIDAAATQVAQKNINLEILDNLTIAIPPRELQASFACRVRRIYEVKRRRTAAKYKCNRMFDCLIQRAFRGQL